jgi:hypothetical protein
MTAAERLQQLSGLAGVSAATMLLAIGAGATPGELLVSRSGLPSGTATAHLLSDVDIGFVTPEKSSGGDEGQRNKRREIRGPDAPKDYYSNLSLTHELPGKSGANDDVAINIPQGYDVPVGKVAPVTSAALTDKILVNVKSSIQVTESIVGEIARTASKKAAARREEEAAMFALFAMMMDDDD